MFGLAYVLLPFSGTPPAEAIAASLARFKRGGRGDVPEEWLRFHDETEAVRTLHQTVFTFVMDGGIKIQGGESWYLDTMKVRAEMERRGRDRWTVRFADLEPDLGRFAARFVRTLKRHPAMGGFGLWLNALGQWDWWDLGGCFDGAITGTPAQGSRGQSAISSGPSRGRDAFEALADALETAVDQDVEPQIDIATDSNIELVSSLVDALGRSEGPRLPSTVVLPPGSVGEEQRWLSSWPELALSPNVGEEIGRKWGATVRAAYERYSDHWAAGIAYHF